MLPEQVPAELVEKVLETRLPSGGLPSLSEPQVRTILAAVLPDIQAQALRDAALELNLPGSTATGYYASEQVAGYNDADRDAEAWLIDRADRLTTKTEGTTT